MYTELSREGVNIPNGFATTAEAYRDFLDHNDLVGPITTALDKLNVDDTKALAKTGEYIRTLINQAAVPEAEDVDGHGCTNNVDSSTLT